MRRVRTAFIGAGQWATSNHMPVLAARDDVEMTGVCGSDWRRLEDVTDAFGFRHATDDYRRLLDLEPDAVVVTSPHHLHAEHATAALECGAHVLCEKPMALEPEAAWRLVALAAARKRELLIPYGWNFKSFIEETKAAMETVGIGEIRFVTCTMASPMRDIFLGLDQLAVPPASRSDPGTWTSPAQGGGYLHGQLTHAAALMLHLTDLEPVVVSGRLSNDASAVDLYTAGTVTFANGAVGTLSGAGTLPNGHPFQLDLRVHGSDGVLLVDVERERAELHRHDGLRHVVPIGEGAGAYTCEVPPSRFIDLIQGDATANPGSGALGARVVELLDALARSHRAGGQPAATRSQEVEELRTGSRLARDGRDAAK
jgi:predicted dehydrogenase